MKGSYWLYPLVVLFVVSTAGCDFIGDVFEAGFWIGVVVVALIVLAGWAVFQFFD